MWFESAHESQRGLCDPVQARIQGKYTFAQISAQWHIPDLAFQLVVAAAIGDDQNFVNRLAD